MQIPGFSDSLSLPSEPPDISNWFGSYKYESFLLDTYDNCGSSVIRDSDGEIGGSLVLGSQNGGKEGNFGEESVRNCQTRHNKLEDQTCNKVPNSLCSVSPLSEPPRIENWFSSYVYESPVLDMAEDSEVNFAKERTHEKDRSLDEGSNNVKDANCEGSRNFGSSDETRNSSQLSTLSEPCHVSNWFASYVYESPALSESIGVADTKSKYIENNYVTRSSLREKEMSSQKSTQSESAEETTIDNMVNNVDVEDNSFTQHIKYGERDQCLDKEFTDYVTNPTTNVTNLSLNNGSSMLTQHQNPKFPGEASFLLFKSNMELSNNNHRRSASKFFRRQDMNEGKQPKAETEVDHVSHGNNDRLHVMENSQGKATHGNNRKEKEEKEGSANGFVTTRKTRNVPSSNENSVIKSIKIPSQCSKSKRLLEGDKGGTSVTRNVLSELTNLEEAAAAEITGKWKCPRKSKPSSRPPLKQLRLEQWVHKL